MRRRIIYYSIISMGYILFGLLGNIYPQTMSEDQQLLRVGIGAFKDGLYDIAEKQFSTFIKSYPQHNRVFDVYYLLGKILLIKGKNSEAKNFFLKIANESKRFENMDDVLFRLAELAMRLGHPEEAARLFLTIIKRFPKFDQIDYAYYQLGLIQLGSNQLSEAESNFKNVSQYSKKADLLRSTSFWLGILAFRQKQYGQAVSYFRSLWEDPNSVPSVYLKYSLFWLGESQFKYGAIQEAKQHYQTFYDRYRNDPLAQEAFWRIGLCEYHLRDIQNAIVTFQSFKNNFKDSHLLSNTHYLLGNMLLMSGDHLASIKEFNTIMSLSEGNKWGGASLLGLFWNYIHLGELEAANRMLQRLQKLNHFEEEKIFVQWLNAELFFSRGELSESLPYYFNILNTGFREKTLFQIGKIYFFEKKFRESITNLEILLLEFPNSKYFDEAMFLRGECLVQLGKVDQALDAYALLVRQNRDSHWHLFTLTQMGTLYSSRNEYDEAENSFKQVMEDFPNHPLFYHAALQLGKLNFHRKAMIEALQYYSIVLKGNILELFGETYFGLGEVFYQQGRYEKALQSFEAAVRYLKETSAWFFLAHLEIGNLKWREENFEDAKKSYLVIIDQSKDEELKRAARELLNRMETR